MADEDRRTAALDRLRHYVGAGADGVFLPGLTDIDVIAEVASTIPAPLNVMLWPGLPTFADLAAAGVRRLSQGGSAFLHAVGYLARMTTNYVQGVVTGVTQANGATSITVNGGPVDWSKVVSVDQLAPTTAATTPTTPATT